MAKKKRSKYVSKGQRPNVSAAVLKLAGADAADRLLHKAAAWRAGKNPWITIKGPSKKEAWVKARANDVWGDPKGRRPERDENK